MVQMKMLRLDRGLSQWELGRAAHMSQGRYSMIERGLIEPTAEERKALAKSLGVAPAHLLRPVALSETELPMIVVGEVECNG
jgi:transcriptional regulator with XRE-family HTH domain